MELLNDNVHKKRKTENIFEFYPNESYVQLFYEKEKWRLKCIEQHINYLKIIKELQDRIEMFEVIDLS